MLPNPFFVGRRGVEPGSDRLLGPILDCGRRVRIGREVVAQQHRRERSSSVTRSIAL